jgi:hypothetical protein
MRQIFRTTRIGGDQRRAMSGWRRIFPALSRDLRCLFEIVSSEK